MALMTDRERAAVQAYLRLLQTVRAALDLAGPTAPAGGAGIGHPPVVAPSLLADADRALAAAGLAGNEGEFFALLRSWCPAVGAAGG
ncbi:hypothetical protein GCM10018793_42330 [Streptomyces sulfonofaciens]|uniref:Uncharacterized protein n=2 Tax=Streptomyces sulfonofaciens TaxID=68272 RepID=A0A919GEG4_9ACTN|nr:hypothetical protein GCM10018793_42330 [Streptomyces sulfonofaciens]